MGSPRTCGRRSCKHFANHSIRVSRESGRPVEVSVTATDGAPERHCAKRLKTVGECIDSVGSLFSSRGMMPFDAWIVPGVSQHCGVARPQGVMERVAYGFAYGTRCATAAARPRGRALVQSATQQMADAVCTIDVARMPSGVTTISTPRF